MICKADLLDGTSEWHCTLDVGHDGDHKAFGVSGELPHRVWPRSPRTWSLPAEPGPEVTAVRCDCCSRVWPRFDDAMRPASHGSWWGEGHTARSWRALVIDHTAGGSKLTDATPTTEETKP